MTRREAYRFAKALEGQLLSFQERVRSLAPKIPGAGADPAACVYYAAGVASGPREWVHLEMSPNDLGRYHSWLRQAVDAIPEAVERVDEILKAARGVGVIHPNLYGAERLHRRVKWLVDAFNAAPSSRERQVVIVATNGLSARDCWEDSAVVKFDGE